MHTDCVLLIAGVWSKTIIFPLSGLYPTKGVLGLVRTELISTVRIPRLNPQMGCSMPYWDHAQYVYKSRTSWERYTVSSGSGEVGCSLVQSGSAWRSMVLLCSSSEQCVVHHLICYYYCSLSLCSVLLVLTHLAFPFILLPLPLELGGREQQSGV